MTNSLQRQLSWPDKLLTALVLILLTGFLLTSTAFAAEKNSKKNNSKRSKQSIKRQYKNKSSNQVRNFSSRSKNSRSKNSGSFSRNSQTQSSQPNRSLSQPKTIQKSKSFSRPSKSVQNQLNSNRFKSSPIKQQKKQVKPLQIRGNTQQQLNQNSGSRKPSVFKKNKTNKNVQPQIRNLVPNQNSRKNLNKNITPKMRKDSNNRGFTKTPLKNFGTKKKGKNFDSRQLGTKSQTRDFINRRPKMNTRDLISGNVNRKDLKGKRIPKLNIKNKDRKDFITQLNNGRRPNRKEIKDAKLNKDLLNNFKKGRVGRVTKPETISLIANSRFGKDLNIKKQFNFRKNGDIARRLHLQDNLRKRGGWRNRKHVGGVHANFVNTHFSSWYVGPSCYPTFCWTPRWNHWVDWCWWDHCYPSFDPRPPICRPIVCEPSPIWSYYECPTWEPLPIVTCGTWIDVPPVDLSTSAPLDVQLLAVRFVDAGHVEQDLGPRYRVWFRNNSNTQISTPFNVVLLSGNDDQLIDGLPQEGSRVETLAAGEVTSVDIRLPMEVNKMGLDEQNRKVPFSFLHVLVDSDRELNDAFRENNGLGINVREILPIDPATFAPETEEAPVGSLLNVAGEGLGPEPGEVLVMVDGKEWPAEIYGWYDLGVRIQVPKVTLSGPTEAELVIVRGDGAASNPITITLIGNQLPNLLPPTP